MARSGHDAGKRGPIMKLRHKLPLATSALLLTAVAAGLFGILALRSALGVYERVGAEDVANERAGAALALQFKTQVQEWKDVLLRGQDPAAREKYWGAFQEHEAKVKDGIEQLIGRLPEGEARNLAQQFAQAHAQMAQDYRKGYAAFEAAGYEAAAGDAAVKGMDRAPSQRLVEMQAKIAEVAAAAAVEAHDNGHHALVLSILLMVAITAAGAVGSVLFSRAVVQPLDRAVQATGTVASGNLGVPIGAGGADEIGQLLASLETMRQSLHQLVSEIRGGVDSVGTASSQIAAGGMDLSARTESQAGSLEETAATMEELTSNVQQGAQNAQRANEFTGAASHAAAKGGELMREVVATMQEITTASQRIAEIIGVIDGIAFQTNILALNAAVEAARAGDQGRGFAVVASEVRSLALKSAQAAKEIRGVIVDSVDRVKAGSRLVDHAGSSVQEILQQISQVAELMGQLTHAASEQSSAIGQVNEAVSQMDQFTQQNAALVEQSAAAATSHKEQAQRLTQAVEVFRLEGTAP
jgi:methyl-accepting chemotaxis protein-1 (serine sensor receptor)